MAKILGHCRGRVKKVVQGRKKKSFSSLLVSTTKNTNIYQDPVTPMNNPRRLKRLTLTCSLCCLLLGFSLTTAAADPAPCKAALTPYEATYTTVYKDIHMEGSRSLRRQDNGQFVLSSSAKKIWASISEQSVFTLVDNRIRVDKYDMSSSVLGIKREYHSMYDWNKGNA